MTIRREMNKQRRNKIFLMGGICRNTGPANVNRNLIMVDSSIWYQKSRNRLIRLGETAIKFLFSNTIVFSAYMRMPIVRLAKLLGKKTVYLMHGYLKFENDVNQQNLSESILKEEDEVLRSVDLVLCVSETYMKWFRQFYPKLFNIHFLHNGIDYVHSALHNGEKRVPNSIAVAGADRPIKNNDIVCKAAEKLPQMGILNPKVNVFGKMIHNEENIFSESSCFLNRGLLGNEEFLKELKKIQLFVVNSTIESFGLVVGEALSCGCSLLISENVGFNDLLELTEVDIIHNVYDTKEISEKMAYLLRHPNNERLVASVDWDHYSKKNAALRLHQICDKLISGEDYSKVR